MQKLQTSTLVSEILDRNSLRLDFCLRSDVVTNMKCHKNLTNSLVTQIRKMKRTLKINVTNIFDFRFILFYFAYFVYFFFCCCSVDDHILNCHKFIYL